MHSQIIQSCRDTAKLFNIKTKVKVFRQIKMVYSERDG